MTPFPGQAAAIIRTALRAMGYTDVQADARLSAFLTEATVADQQPPRESFSDVRTQALRDAYWAHREVPGRHRGECCQDRCMPDIVERWISETLKRTRPPALANQPAAEPSNE